MVRKMSKQRFDEFVEETRIKLALLKYYQIELMLRHLEDRRKNDE